MVGLGALVELALGAVGEVLYERLKFLQENFLFLQTLPQRSGFLPKHNLRMVTKNILRNQSLTMLESREAPKSSPKDVHIRAILGNATDVTCEQQYLYQKVWVVFSCALKKLVSVTATP